MTKFRLKLGDCLDVMRDIPDNSFHSVITDPPYGLKFMGKNWDRGIPGKIFWEEILRVSKPGAHLLAFGGTRTHHRLMVAIEDAGWEIRDCLMWLYGSGFPKSMDISKAIDKAAGKVGEFGDYKTPDHAIKRKPGNQRLHEGYQRPWRDNPDIEDRNSRSYLPATDAALQWQGWGTALKPAWEPIIMAMKPLDGTYANNALVHGVAGLNIDACRIGADERTFLSKGIKPGSHNMVGSAWDGNNGEKTVQGRWPANLLLDDEAAALLDQMSGVSKSGVAVRRNGNNGHGTFPVEIAIGSEDSGYSDSSGASRFFYCAKASKRDRDEGLEGMELRRVAVINAMGDEPEGEIDPVSARFTTTKRNHHPTVKPTQLMRYLCRLITPSNGIVFDPFMGSGSTGKAALLEGFRFYGIEKEKEYLEISHKRIESILEQLGK